MPHTFIQILEWILPAGGLASVAAWLVSKNLRQAREAKEVSDTYQELYESVSQTVLELGNEIRKLRKIVSRLERAVSKSSTCLHYDNCPVRHELFDNEKNDDDNGGEQGNGIRGEVGQDNASGGAALSGNAASSDRGNTKTAGRRGLRRKKRTGAGEGQDTE